MTLTTPSPPQDRPDVERVEQKPVGHWRLVGSRGPWFHVTEDRKRIAYVLTTKIRIPVKLEPGRENAGAHFHA